MTLLYGQHWAPLYTGNRGPGAPFTREPGYQRGAARSRHPSSINALTLSLIYCHEFIVTDHLGFLKWAPSALRGSVKYKKLPSEMAMVGPDKILILS